MRRCALRMANAMDVMGFRSLSLGSALSCILYLGTTSICFRVYVCMMTGFLFSRANSHDKKRACGLGDIVGHLWWLSGFDCRDISKHNSTLQQLHPPPPFWGQNTSIDCGTVSAAVTSRASGASDGTEMVPTLVGSKIGPQYLSNYYCTNDRRKKAAAAAAAAAVRSYYTQYLVYVLSSTWYYFGRNLNRLGCLL